MGRKGNERGGGIPAASLIASDDVRSPYHAPSRVCRTCGPAPRAEETGPRSLCIKSKFHATRGAWAGQAGDLQAHCVHSSTLILYICRDAFSRGSVKIGEPVCLWGSQAHFTSPLPSARPRPSPSERTAEEESPVTWQGTQQGDPCPLGAIPAGVPLFIIRTGVLIKEEWLSFPTSPLSSAIRE